MKKYGSQKSPTLAALFADLQPVSIIFALGKGWAKGRPITKQYHFVTDTTKAKTVFTRLDAELGKLNTELNLNCSKKSGK